jgi:alginate O-acetyltransferase complex protein AlgI
MLFNSYTFMFVFAPLVYAVWWRLAGRERSRLVWITLASYAFYCYFEFPRGLQLLPLLLISTTADYVAGKRISGTTNQRARNWWLAGALGINLGLLAFFKYLGLFQGIANAIMALAGVPMEIPVSHIVLPLGISFYTFNSMSYTIDIYRGEAVPARSLVHYTSFVALFPHLLAGPIVRYTDIADQLHRLKHRLTSGMVALGTFFFICGLTKKVVFADSLAPTIDRLFAANVDLPMLSAWAASLGFFLQMYFDFSGYSDMAVGLALMLGFSFPQNFASPFKAGNVTEFWRRWHMTLSRWVRDYVFRPLGGSRGSSWLTTRNVIVSMVVVGLWHGAAPTFIVFGLYHGVMMAVHALTVRARWPSPPAWLARPVLFVLLTIGAAIFRAPDMNTAWRVITGMFGVNGLGLTHVGGGHPALAIGGVFGIALIALTVWVHAAPNTFEYQFQANRRTAIMLGGMLAVSLVMLTRPSPFLYFQF